MEPTASRQRRGEVQGFVGRVARQVLGSTSGVVRAEGLRERWRGGFFPKTSDW